LPADLPEVIEVDVSGLQVEDVIAISKLPLPPNVVAVYSDADMPVFACAIPRAEAEATTTEEGAVAEPEVIEKGKKAEEGEEAAAAATPKK
jgi:large subunit ribosomal protein L25